LHTVNGLEWLNREVRRRSRVAVLLSSEASCLRLVTAIIMEISEDWETGRVYLRLDKD
jgi:putative transposase